jgi:energy-coupling factor transporter ATP-binding protein EcfA2
VSVEFDGKLAVDDVTLSIVSGEWVALVGANGSGKSTLTGLAVGLGKPSAGAVRFRDTVVKPGRIFEHSAQVALLLQAADEMLFAETVRAELEFGTKFRALPPNPVLDVHGAIEFFGFTGQQEISPWELSQGSGSRWPRSWLGRPVSSCSTSPLEARIRITDTSGGSPVLQGGEETGGPRSGPECRTHLGC